MKQTYKTMAAGLLSFVLTLTICGCGNTRESSVVKEFDDVKTVTLSMLTSRGMSDNFWTQDYVAKDGVKIKIAEYTADYYDSEKLTYRELVAKRIKSNVDIDLYVIHAEDVIEFNKLGYWMDLSGLNAVSCLSPDALAQSTYDGKVFSIPLSYTGFGFWWNVDMLKEHGLSVPGNLPEFLNVCQVLKEAGVTPYLGNKGYALTVPAMAMGFSELYAAADADQRLADLSSGTTPVSTYMAKGFAFIEMMIENGYMNPEQALNSAPGHEDVADFLAGKGAFLCSNIEANIKSPDFEIDMTGIPVSESGTVAVVGANYRLAVNPNSPNAHYATELIDSLVTPEWLAQAAAREYTLSSGNDEYDLSYLDSSLQDFARLAGSGGQVPNQDFALHFNTWECIRDICRQICNGQSAADATQEYDRIQQEQIAAYDN